ncbi:MAG TPA: hypothetical protein VGM62_03510 [Chthoniobacterales bacterium]
MISLLTDRAAKPALRASSFAARKRTRAAALSDKVWELHRIIASPISRIEEVRMAKRQLLRELRKSHTLLSRESKRRSTRSFRFDENRRAAAATTTI